MNEATLLDRRPFAPVFALTAALALSAVLAPAGAGDGPLLATEVVATGLVMPVGVASIPDDPRLFVLEQNTGVVRIVRDGVVEPEPFLDVSADFVGGSERGLLGLAFHPNYGVNGRVFVYYNAEGGSFGEGVARIVEFSANHGKFTGPTTIT